MRLICPNCSAQYEVGTVMLPDGGRNVQCSSCAHVWFQAGDGEARADYHDAPDPEEYERGDEHGDEAERPAPPPRRELDERTRAILREEAAREAAARRGNATRTGEPSATDATGQPADAGTEDGAAAPKPAPSVAASAAMPEAGTRRPERLPDADKLTSTLAPAPPPARPASDHHAPRAERHPESPDRRGGARLGFWLVILFAALLAICYFAAPRIAEIVPSLEPSLARYVEAVNGLRAGIGEVFSGVTGDADEPL